MDADTETTSSHSTALHYIRQRAALHYQSGMYMRPFLWRPSQTETLKPETEAETEALTIQAEARPRPRPSELETETRPRHINSDVRLSRNTTAPRDGRDRGVKTEATLCYHSHHHCHHYQYITQRLPHSCFHIGPISNNNFAVCYSVIK